MNMIRRHLVSLAAAGLILLLLVLILFPRVNEPLVTIATLVTTGVAVLTAIRKVSTWREASDDPAPDQMYATKDKDKGSSAWFFRASKSAGQAADERVNRHPKGRAGEWRATSGSTAHPKGRAGEWGCR